MMNRGYCRMLKIIAEYRANILTIHQEYSHQRNRFSDIEYSGIADHGDISRMIEQLEGQPSVHHVKILAKE